MTGTSVTNGSIAPQRKPPNPPFPIHGEGAGPSGLPPYCGESNAEAWFPPFREIGQFYGNIATKPNHFRVKDLQRIDRVLYLKSQLGVKNPRTIELTPESVDRRLAEVALLFQEFDSLEIIVRMVRSICPDIKTTENTLDAVSALEAIAARITQAMASNRQVALALTFAEIYFDAAPAIKSSKDAIGVIGLVIDQITNFGLTLEDKKCQQLLYGKNPAQWDARLILTAKIHLERISLDMIKLATGVFGKCHIQGQGDDAIEKINTLKEFPISWAIAQCINHGALKDAYASFHETVEIPEVLEIAQTLTKEDAREDPTDGRAKLQEAGRWTTEHDKDGKTIPDVNTAVMAKYLDLPGTTVEELDHLVQRTTGCYQTSLLWRLIENRKTFLRVAKELIEKQSFSDSDATRYRQLIPNIARVIHEGVYRKQDNGDEQQKDLATTS